MAYKNKFIQLTWGGTYFSDDIWVNGLHIIDTGLLPNEEIDDAFHTGTLNAFVTRISEMHTNVAGNSQQAKLEWVKMAMIGTDGKYTVDPMIVDITPLAGGRTGAMYPQLATAVSLRTAKKRGAGAYGRFYAPVALQVEPTGRSHPNAVTEFLTLIQGFLTGLNLDLANNTVDNTAVLGNVSKVGTGSQDEITGVFIGDLTDTQRRRRNKLQENYEGLTV
jgi:hypothetical protein